MLQRVVGQAQATKPDGPPATPCGWNDPVKACPAASLRRQCIPSSEVQTTDFFPLGWRLALAEPIATSRLPLVATSSTLVFPNTSLGSMRVQEVPSGDAQTAPELWPGAQQSSPTETNPSRYPVVANMNWLPSPPNSSPPTIASVCVTEVQATAGLGDGTAEIGGTDDAGREGEAGSDGAASPLGVTDGGTAQALTRSMAIPAAASQRIR